MAWNYCYFDDFDAFGNEQFREMRFAEVKMDPREDLIFIKK